MLRRKNDLAPTILFLMLAFLMPLLSILFIRNFVAFQSGILYFILYGFEAATPTLSTLLVVLVFSRGKQFTSFLKKCYIENIRVDCILFAILLPLMVLLAAKLTYSLFSRDAVFATGISSRKLIIILWALVAEEVGWRGFLQEKLDVYFGNLFTPLVLGILWALWHYHFFLSGSMSVPLVLFVLGCITDSYVYYWITKKSKGNIIPASLCHFTSNLFFNILLINPELNHGSTLPYLLYVVYSFMMAVFVTICGISSTKRQRSPRQHE